VFEDGIGQFGGTVFVNNQRIELQLLHQGDKALLRPFQIEWHIGRTGPGGSRDANVSRDAARAEDSDKSRLQLRAQVTSEASGFLCKFAVGDYVFARLNGESIRSLFRSREKWARYVEVVVHSVRLSKVDPDP